MHFFDKSDGKKVDIDKKLFLNILCLQKLLLNTI